MFNLLRYFSITSAIVLLVATVLLTLLYRHVTITQLIHQGEKFNIAITGALSNSIWPEFRHHANSVSGLSGHELRVHPTTPRLRDAVLAQIANLSVLKVKIYSPSGLTVFSTQASQIGEDKSANPGFIIASSGGVASELTHRDTFSTFENVIEDRDVLSSYVPINGDGSQVQGVFEVYYDVTSLLGRIEEVQRFVFLVSISGFSLLYSILFLIVRHADHIIIQQRKKILVGEAALAQSVAGD